jgi:hypothetical protein
MQYPYTETLRRAYSKTTKAMAEETTTRVTKLSLKLEYNLNTDQNLTPSRDSLNKHGA